MNAPLRTPPLDLLPMTAEMVEAVRRVYRKTELYARYWEHPEKAAAHAGPRPKDEDKRNGKKPAPKRTRS